MLVVSHNLLAQNANRQFNIVTGQKTKSTEKLSSGYRINRSADDAAGLAISEKMRFQIRGLDRASQNIQDGISLVQVADGALSEIHSMLHRMKELSIQASNDTNTDTDRAQLQNEVSQLKKEISRTFNTTEFNTMPIFRCPYTLGVSEDPNDIQLFNADASGNQLTGSGGLIFNSKRYTFGELGANVSNGIFNADFSTSFTDPDNGELIELSAKKGDSVADIIRYYQVTSDTEGAYVNNLPAARWAETPASGKWAGIDTFSIEDGMYTFNFHGMDISFAPDGEDDRETIISRLNPDTLSSEKTMYFMSRAAGTKGETAVNSSVGTMVLDVTNSTKGSISDFSYEISADNDGVTVRQTNGNDNITHKKIAWSDFVNTKTGDPFRFTDFGLTDEGANPQTFDASATYRYSDLTDHPDMETYLEFTFTVKDEASKQGIIDGLNGIKLTAGSVSAPLNAGGTTDKTGVTLYYHSDFSFEYQRDYLGRTFNDEPSIASIEGTVSRERVYNGSVWSYAQAQNMQEAYVKKITETIQYANDDSTIISRNSSDEYEKLTSQQPPDTQSSGIGADHTQTVTRYETNSSGSFSYYYKNGDQMKNASGSLYEKSVSGGVIGNDEDHTTYTNATIGSGGQKYISTGSVWVKDKEFQLFTNRYEYKNPDETTIMTGSDQNNFSEDRISHIDSRNNVKDWKGNTVDTSDAYYKNSSLTFRNESGSDVRYATAYALDSVFLDDPFGNKITLYYDNLSDSADGSGSSNSTVNTKIMPSDEAKRTFKKASASKGSSLRTDYESVTPPPPEKLVHIQSGALGFQSIDLKWNGMSLSSIGLGSANVSTYERAQRTIKMVDKATDIVSSARAKFGAYQNRLEYAMRIDDYTAENTSSAESRIRDTDMAKESVAFAKHNILEQVGQSVLTQANQSTQGVLQILR